MPVKCAASTLFRDGRTAKCSQAARHDSDYCYYHDKLSQGFGSPTESDYPEEDVIAVLDKRTLIPIAEGACIEAELTAVA